MSDSFIWRIDRTVLGAATPDISGSESESNEGLLRIQSDSSERRPTKLTRSKIIIHSNFSERPSTKTDVKNSQGVDNNNNNKLKYWKDSEFKFEISVHDLVE